MKSRLTAAVQHCAMPVLAGLALVWGPEPAWAQLVDNQPRSLKTVPTPEPANLNQFLVADKKGINGVSATARAAVIALGKALFWDQAVGSDGQACASCHFNAGADSRTRNQVDPGLRAIPAQSVFGATPAQDLAGTGFPFHADYQLRKPSVPPAVTDDFPLVKFNTPGVRSSGIASDTQAVVSSAGVINTTFGDVTLSACPGDQSFIGNICDTRNADTGGNGATFNGGALFTAANGIRNVEPRNTPSVVNAVFNYRNFWDSRARNEFNGADPIGDLDPYARVLIAGKGLQKVALNNASIVNGVKVPNPFGTLRLEDASLASQAVGPALSDMEMSAQRRSFAKLGKKMLAFPIALPAQIVAPDDSVLGNNKAAGVKSNCASIPCAAFGINKSYAALIQAAFQPRWWSGSQMVEFTGTTDADGTVGLKISKPAKALTTNQFTQMEFNFSMFWGLAIQMYEATLRADDSPFDQAFDLSNPRLDDRNPIDPNVRLPAGCDDVSTPCLWGPKQLAGWLLFQGAGKCINCHGGPELTNASVRNVRLIDGKTEIMSMGDLGFAVYDVGSYNTAVRRCLDQSAGPAACDDGGVGTTLGPLNLPLSFVRFAELWGKGDPRITTVCNNQPEACGADLQFIPGRVAVDGSFKAPGLRNVELTAPYEHNGDELTLMDVVNFYDMGGNFPEYNIQNLDPDIGNIQCLSVTVDVSGKALCNSGDLQFLELGLSATEKGDLVAFMKALTDERVRMQRAPFDHPQLFLPNLPLDSLGCPQCRLGELPAVGNSGTDVYGDPAHPLPTFMQNLAP